MLYYQKTTANEVFTAEELKKSYYEALDKVGKRNKILAIPPDITRMHSRAGELTELTYQYYRDGLKAVLPALGTHSPMTLEQKVKMFKSVPNHLFIDHDWRSALVTLGTVPGAYVKEVSEGKLDYDWPAQVNKELVEGGYDLILSIGQVVPHEVIGMANYNKNIFVGTGGVEGINKSHFLGAVHGIERILGTIENPVRQVLNYASDHFAQELPIVYVQTVVGLDKSGKQGVKGLYVGDDVECFELAAKQSIIENFTLLDKPLKKVVVYLDPEEFKSTWLGNKSVYRTRMAIADDGELIVLGPGVKEFGEDKEIDKLIRKYGYVGQDKVLELTKANEDLQNNLSAAAHLIHGSSEDRFTITYCPGHLTQAEIEQVNFKYGDLLEMSKKYDVTKLKDGYNTMPDGEEIFYISNPATGLWANKDRFK
jgi:nickel-dependent lactate racemase